MKYLLVLVMLTASPAWADWKFVTGNESKGTEFFIETDGIRREGNFVRVWELTNYLTPRVLNKIEFLSMRSRVEYDCKQDRSKTHSISIFANLYARDLIQTESLTQSWEDVPPRTIQWDLLQSVCKASAR
jgi:hypothetical protein